MLRCCASRRVASNITQTRLGSKWNFGWSVDGIEIGNWDWSVFFFLFFVVTWRTEDGLDSVEEGRRRRQEKEAFVISFIQQSHLRDNFTRCKSPTRVYVFQRMPSSSSCAATAAAAAACDEFVTERRTEDDVWRTLGDSGPPPPSSNWCWQHEEPECVTLAHPLSFACLNFAALHCAALLLLLLLLMSFCLSVCVCVCDAMDMAI